MEKSHSQNSACRSGGDVCRGWFGVVAPYLHLGRSRHGGRLAGHAYVDLWRRCDGNVWSRGGFKAIPTRVLDSHACGAWCIPVVEYGTLCCSTHLSDLRFLLPVAYIGWLVLNNKPNYLGSDTPTGGRKWCSTRRWLPASTDGYREVSHTARPLGWVGCEYF